jgi:hypothetical protein
MSERIDEVITNLEANVKAIHNRYGQHPEADANQAAIDLIKELIKELNTPVAKSPVAPKVAK